MPANTKPVPWNEIQHLFEGGLKPPTIAKRMAEQGHKISRQSIDKRANKEGWSANPQAVKVRQAADAWRPAVTTNSATRDTLSTGPSRSATQIANWGKRTPENAAEILAHVQLTGDEKLAARAVGIHPDTLKNWKDSDPDFSAQVSKAQAMFCGERVQEIRKAGERGDWKASDRLLAVNPLTKEDYGQQGQSGGTGITLNFNFPRATESPREEDIIDVEPV